MPDEVKPNAPAQATPAAKDERQKERLFEQSEVNYTAVSVQPGKACAGCRWFETWGDEYSTQDGCHLVQSWPLPIEPTGYCDRYEAYPSPQPVTQTPMPVVIVDPADAVEEGAAEKQEKALLERIWSGIQQRLGLKAGEPEVTGIKVVGNHWLAVWSNNFEDRDGEIFTAKAIDDYVARVDMGIVPKPELWVWHLPGTRIGQAQWVGRHDHFVIAMGDFDATSQGQAARDYYSKQAGKKNLSHGYQFHVGIGAGYTGGDFDGKHYHAFNTFEISLLPRGSEANMFTSLEGVKTMVATISEAKKAELFAVFGEEEGKRVLANLEAKGKALEDLGVTYKDFTGQDLTSANKQAAEAAEKSLKDLFPELVEGSGEAVTAALEVVKLAKVEKAAREAHEKNTTAIVDNLKAEIDKLRAEMRLRPRSASRAEETVIADKDLTDKVKSQLTERDPFWGTEVPQTP